MRKVRRWWLGCAMLIAMLGGAGSAHAAAWATPATTIYTGAGGFSTVRDIAAAEDQAGNAYAVWWDLNTGNLYVSERPAGGSFPATAQLLAHSTNDMIPQIAVDASGNVIVVWTDNSQVLHGVQQAPGGTFQPLTLPTTSGAQFAQIAAGGDGTVIIAWEQGGQIMYSLRRSGGSFGAAATMPGSTNLYTFSIAADQAGDIGVGLITFTGAPPNNTWSVHGGYWDHNGSGFNVSGTALDTQASSSDPTRTIGNIKVVMSPGGDSVATWTTSCSGMSNPCSLSPPPNSSSALVASIRKAGQATSFGTKTSVATSTASPNAFWTPGVAFDGSGNVVMAWGLTGGSSTEVDQSQASVASGGFSPPALVASTGTGVPYVAMGSLASGQLVLVYTAGTSSATQVWGALRPNGPLGTAFGAATQISAISSAILEAPPMLATQGNDAFVDWALYNAPPAIQGVGYSGNPPTVTVTSPPTGTTGQPISVSASALGIWTTASVSNINFGDGSASSSGASATHTFTAAGTYTVTATATDGAGNTGTGTKQIVVAAAQGPSGPTTGPSGPTGPTGTTGPPPPKPKCVVPKLKGKTLAAAKRALKAHHCRLGKVRRPKRHKHSKPVKLVVLAQSRRAGAKLPQGTKVNVRLGPAPKRHRRHRASAASIAAIRLPMFPL